MNITSVASGAFRATLLLNMALANAVKSPQGNFKVFKTVADGDFKSPYILIGRIYGGEDNENPQRSFDMIFRIGAVSTDQVEAENLATLIEASLINVTPTAFKGWTFWAPITQVQPYDEKRVIQSVPHYETGAQYRIRAVMNKE